MSDKQFLDMGWLPVTELKRDHGKVLGFTGYNDNHEACFLVGEKYDLRDGAIIDREKGRFNTIFFFQPINCPLSGNVE